MAIAAVFAGVAVADYPAARAWYERLMGREADMLPHATEAAWQLAAQTWLYVVGDAERAGKALVTVMVDDLDKQIAELRERGLTVGPLETVPGLYRKVVVADPEGNQIAFGDVPAAQG